MLNPRLLAGIGLSALMATAAFAAPQNQTPYQGHWYMGIGAIAPSSHTHTNVEHIYTESTLKYFTHENKRSLSTGWAIFGGYRATKKWGAEIGFYDAGEYKYTDNYYDYGPTPSSSPTIVTHTAKGHSYDLGVTALRYFDFGNSPFSAYLRFGTEYHFANDSGKSSDFTNDTSKDTREGAGFTYGLGVQYQVAQKVNLRADYILFNQYSLTNELNSGRFMLSGTFNF